MARGPIKHTCPDIDREQRNLNSRKRDLLDLVDKFDAWTISDIKEALKDLADRYEEAHDFLEEMRESNDALRCWGAEMEDLAAARQEEIDSLESQLSTLQS